MWKSISYYRIPSKPLTPETVKCMVLDKVLVVCVGLVVWLLFVLLYRQVKIVFLQKSQTKITRLQFFPCIYLGNSKQSVSSEIWDFWKGKHRKVQKTEWHPLWWWCISRHQDKGTFVPGDVWAQPHHLHLDLTVRVHTDPAHLMTFKVNT